jgi:transposase
VRGPDTKRSQEQFTASPEDLVPADHPLRSVKAMADAVLSEMSPIFESIYSFAGRPSIPPERLLRAQLLQLLYSVRSERMLMEQLGYNMLFRWFVGMSGTESVWDASTYAKNRERFIAGAVADEFFGRVVAKADKAGLMSDEHFR